MMPISPVQEVKAGEAEAPHAEMMEAEAPEEQHAPAQEPPPAALAPVAPAAPPAVASPTMSMPPAAAPAPQDLQPAVPTPTPAAAAAVDQPHADTAIEEVQPGEPCSLSFLKVVASCSATALASRPGAFSPPFSCAGVVPDLNALRAQALLAKRGRSPPPPQVWIMTVPIICAPCLFVHSYLCKAACSFS
jgi:hypothetical protein